MQENLNKSQPELESEHKHGESSVSNDRWGTNPSNGTMSNINGLGFDVMNGGFPNMGFNGTGDFSQMLQFMPNGMQHNSIGSIPNMMSMAPYNWKRYN